VSEPRLALVTGASGFIGSHLALRLQRDGWRLRLLVRDPARLAPALRGAAQIALGNLRDPAAMNRAVAGADVIFHCAANVRTWDRWESYLADNVEGVAGLVDAVARENPRLLRLVHLSTMDVYGFPRTPCDESCETRASGFGYGDSKRLGEVLLRERAERAGIACTILRPGNVIGAGSPFVERIGQALRGGAMLRIDGGRAHAGLLDVDNLVDVMLWAAQAPAAAGRCYNVRDSLDLPWKGFLGALRRRIGSRGVFVDLPFAAADALAFAWEAAHRLARRDGEPLLHRLVVRLFGRTCGHSAQRLRLDCGFEGAVGFEASLGRACAAFLAREAAARGG
jgi:nucleoside-diphosphate-sugar epimerase